MKMTNDEGDGATSSNSNVRIVLLDPTKMIWIGVWGGGSCICWTNSCDIRFL
jgi:hypothetical protein